MREISRHEVDRRPVHEKRAGDLGHAIYTNRDTADLCCCELKTESCFIRRAADTSYSPRILCVKVCVLARACRYDVGTHQKAKSDQALRPR